MTECPVRRKVEERTRQLAAEKRRPTRFVLQRGRSSSTRHTRFREALHDRGQSALGLARAPYRSFKAALGHLGCAGPLKAPAQPEFVTANCLRSELQSSSTDRSTIDYSE